MNILEKQSNYPVIKFKKGNIKDIPPLPTLAQLAMGKPFEYSRGISEKKTVKGFRRCYQCREKHPIDKLTKIGKSICYVFCEKCAPLVKDKRARLGK